MAALDPADGIKFADFDLTLTDRELDEFLSFMEHQTTGVYADTMPQLPVDFPGLQLQPHSGSPSHSEGSDSAGVGTSGAAGTASNSARRRALAASDGSLTSATMSSPPRDPAACGVTSQGHQQQQQQQQQVSPASSPMDISSQQVQSIQQLLQPMDIKLEPGMPLLPISSSLPAGFAASAGSAAAATGTTLAGSIAMGDGSTLMASCPSTLHGTQPGFCLQPMQWHSSSIMAAAAASAAPAQQPVAQSLPQAMPQLLFVQGATLPALQQQQQHLPLQQQPSGAFSPLQQQQQQQQSMELLQPPAMNQQVAAFAGLTTTTTAAAPSSSTQADHYTAGTASGRASRQLQQQQQQHRVSYEANGSKLQISHSTVEKQRRDRLNSLIDELSDMVPPADPKYGGDTNSVRRPKHVVLADTINLLKAMQTKLQIEEAEICTLKQQAAAVGAIAAQLQVGHAAVPEAADALMHAAAAASPEQYPAAAAYGDACGGPLELPSAPESGANSTGVLVEQGIGCLYVKVNCKDRKGLLSDVVSALKAFPIVISTAAITTTKDGKVHDVFEVSSSNSGCD